MQRLISKHYLILFYLVSDDTENEALKEEIAKLEKKINEYSAKLDTINQKIDDSHEE